MLRKCCIIKDIFSCFTTFFCRWNEWWCLLKYLSHYLNAEMKVPKVNSSVHKPSKIKCEDYFDKHNWFDFWAFTDEISKAIYFIRENGTVYLDIILIYSLSTFWKYIVYCVFHQVWFRFSYCLCASLSLICWYVWRCLAEFINILIIDSYFWFATAVGVPRGLKLDSHNISVTPHLLYSCPPPPSLKNGKPSFKINLLVAILCPLLDSKLHEVYFACYKSIRSSSIDPFNLMLLYCAALPLQAILP